MRGYSKGEYEQHERRERPPPFNPDAVSPPTFQRPPSLHMNMSANAINGQQQQQKQEQQQQQQSRDYPPPYYHPDIDEPVVWDEKLTSTEQQRRSSGFPVTPRDENGHFAIPPSPSSSQSSTPSRAGWTYQTKHLAKGTWNSVKRFEEKHQLSIKTKKGAKSAYKQTKRATLTASQKLKEFDETHQIVQKSKDGIVQGSNYVVSKCRRRRHSTYS